MDAKFKNRGSKEKLEKLLVAYGQRYQINNTSVVEPQKTERVTPPKSTPNMTPKERPSKEGEVEAVQAKISEILQADRLNFRRNKSYLTKKSKKTLDGVIALLKKIPQMRIEVQGHTDASGDRDTNQWISTARAKRVKYYLEKHGIEAKRIVAKGFGESRLLYKEKPRSRLNRRVEIIIKGDK